MDSDPTSRSVITALLQCPLLPPLLQELPRFFSATTAISRATAVFLCYHCYFKSYRGLTLLPPLLQKLPRFSLLPPLIQELPRFPLLPPLLQGLPGFFSATKGVIPYVTSPVSPSPTTSGLEARLCVAGLLTIWEAAHLHPTVAFGRKRAALPHLTLA